MHREFDSRLSQTYQIGTCHFLALPYPNKANARLGSDAGINFKVIGLTRPGFEHFSGVMPEAFIYAMHSLAMCYIQCLFICCFTP